MQIRPYSTPPGALKTDSRTPSTVRFSGLLDGLATAIGKIDGSEFAQLIVLDGTGMIIPRTSMEAAKRGLDAGRETGIREVSGLVGNMFLAGWASYLMLNLLGKGVNFYNPQGIPAKAWINAKNLEAFSRLYVDILHEAAASGESPAEARVKLIERFLGGLESTNPQLGKTALTEWQEKNLPAADLERFRKQVSLGRLDPDTRAALAGHLRLKPAGAMSISGTTPFSELALKLAEAEADEQVKLGKLTTGGKADYVRKAFVQERHRLSVENIKGNGAKLIEILDHSALNGGLTNTVNLHAPNGDLLVGGKKRHDILRDFVNYLEQCVDRVTHDAASEPGRSWTDKARQGLFGSTQKRGLLARLLPQADEGLFHSLRKSKLAYTIVPVIMAAMGSVSVAFYNNWLTQKKHGGKRFSPFEGGPPPDGKPVDTKTIGTTKANAPTGGLVPGVPLVRRNGFAQFQQAHHPQGAWS